LFGCFYHSTINTINNRKVIPKWKRKNNNDEIYLNDIVMEEKTMEGDFEIQSSLQTKKNNNVDEGKEKMKENLKKMETRQ
jgi:hypothetical protein